MKTRHKTVYSFAAVIFTVAVLLMVRTHSSYGGYKQLSANINISITSTLLKQCSTVHIGMVATSSSEGIALYNTLKSVFMHRSTPLHFHFIVDKHTQLILQTMLDSWLLPGVSQDYYFIDNMPNLIDSNTNYTKDIPSLLLGLESVIPHNVSVIMLIEPPSVVTVDLALHLANDLQEHDPIQMCGPSCVTYCPGAAKVQAVSWGAMSVKLNSWSGSYKMDWKIKHASMDTCDMVREFDGETLRYIEYNKCVKHMMEPIMPPLPNVSDKCAMFKWERNTKRREVPHILGHSYTARDKYDITLSLQLSVTRLPFLSRILSYWDGPASVGIHVTDSEVQGVLNFLKNNSLHNRLNVTYHFVFSIGGTIFPVNVVRAVSHRFVQTPYFLLMDIDFVPQPGLYQKLREKLKNQVFGNTRKTVIVIPSFETFDNKSIVPATKSEMVNMLNQGKFTQFHGKVFNLAQGPTNYAKWRKAKRPYYIEWKSSYEPFTVLETSTITFDGQFLMRFWSKTVYFAELHMAKYKFIVAHDLFVMHFPHTNMPRNMTEYRVCGEEWFMDWLKSKKEQYGYQRNDIKFLHL